MTVFSVRYFFFIEIKIKDFMVMLESKRIIERNNKKKKTGYHINQLQMI